MQNLFINIRKAEEKDIPVIMQIERLCFDMNRWKKENIIYEMKENPVANLWVIELSIDNEEGYRVVGFSDYWHTFDSATICQIAVHPYLQRKQLGSALMDEIYNDCYAKKVKNITLEVRVSNEKAINFYKKHGFKIETIKPRYYDNGEDAYYMILKVT
ncbi:MAG TPA: ribosomal protein S18-alanine N-acetyltransferase [Erysipelotrichaceae bacterium]|nr:ribosomal protein S18-alanine N-acetyltransferase [Erysipelotrichaceae bacterium]